MKSLVIEAKYPISFHAETARSLGKYLKSRHNVMLIGMKRVGISNFLRFFLYHKDIISAYIDNSEKHLFIPVDLNDLVEREIYPFWILTLKRIVDAVEGYKLDKKVKKHIQNLFLESIQSKDLFILKENIRKSIIYLSKQKILPTLFYIRFDRIKNVITTEVFDNLKALQEASHYKLTYVFTSDHSLNRLAPHVFSKAGLLTFVSDLYVTPICLLEARSIYQTLEEKYKLKLSTVLKDWLFSLVGGHIQYLQLALICLEEQLNLPKTKDELFARLISDERIILQSEELWESLNKIEQEILLKINKDVKISSKEREQANHLFDTGFVCSNKGSFKIFSPLLSYFLQEQKKIFQQENIIIDFSKKENLLFNLLQKNLNEICEREEIIEAVWPEQEAIGVSDWAIDRLIARLRNKLKLQNSQYEIQTL